MNSLRIARAALRARPAALRAPLQRRGYAEAVSDKVRPASVVALFEYPNALKQIKLSLSLPHQVRDGIAVLALRRHPRASVQTTAMFRPG
jgi:hypothetical protein